MREDMLKCAKRENVKRHVCARGLTAACWLVPAPPGSALTGPRGITVQPEARVARVASNGPQCSSSNVNGSVSWTYEGAAVHRCLLL